nr:unnamed protein product [Digitaria exilis]
MVEVGSRVRGFLRNRWLVFVAAMWMQSCAGVGYLFGSLSPVIKSSLGYNQRQVAGLGVAKDLGDSVGFLAGTLCAVLPLWAALLIGAAQNLVGYGWVWLAVTRRVPVPPLWAMCILIFIGNNGETYFNTAALVSCVQNFPKSRGPIVGILKGFAGLSGAILTQIYAIINTPDDAALIFMVAVGPTMVVIALMFIVRPVGGHRQIRPSDGTSFTFVYSVCLLLAAYLMGVMLLEDLVELSQEYTYPRAIALAIAQVLMAIGHFNFAMAWPGTMYVGTLLVGVGYGAHWAIVPAAASELFGVKYFGALYNFLTVANPAGSLVFSGIIASGIYDAEAAKQAQQRHNSTLLAMPARVATMISEAAPALKCEGAICFFLSSLIMSGFCIIAVVLSLILVYRTKIVYTSLYGKQRT